MPESEPSSFDLLRAVLDPIRLAVLGGSVGTPVSIASIEQETGADRGEIARAIGSLRSDGLLDAEGRLVSDVLRTIAQDLPSDRVRPDSLDGTWTPNEVDVLARFFDGDRLLSIPTNMSKRRLVLERIAQDFEPGVRYHERDVNFRLQLVFADYAAIRRYLVDEGFMDRADGDYWRTGGRHPTTGSGDSTERHATRLETSRADVSLRAYGHEMTYPLVEAANHVDINRYMSDRFPYPYTPDDAREWISFTLDDPVPLNYAVFVGEELVGGVGARHLGLERTGSFEIGWWLTPSRWGAGITTSAASAFVDELFTSRGAMTLWAPVMAPNTASAAVATKIGMVLEGSRRSFCLKRGVRYDQLDFGLTKDLWASP